MVRAFVQTNLTNGIIEKDQSTPCFFAPCFSPSAVSVLWPHSSLLPLSCHRPVLSLYIYRFLRIQLSKLMKKKEVFAPFPVKPQSDDKHRRKTEMAVEMISINAYTVEKSIHQYSVQQR